MQVSFIIPLFNCLDHTRECIRSLQATIPRRLSHEIILVDDGSTDGTREWLKTLGTPFRVILNETNLGYARANNRAAATATGDCLFFLNNDLVLRRGWFKPMHRVVRRRGRVGLVGNVQLRVNTTEIDHCGVDIDRKGKPKHVTHLPWWIQLTGRRKSIALTGACFAVKEKLWRKLGGFDPVFVNGCEDIDLCLRARSLGLRNVVATRSVIWHHVSQSPGRKLRDEENTRRLLKRWRSFLEYEVARQISREWSRDYIPTVWDKSCVIDYAMAGHALGNWLGVYSIPSAPALAIAHRLLALEFDRWDQILGPDPDL